MAKKRVATVVIATIMMMMLPLYAYALDYGEYPVSGYAGSTSFSGAVYVHASSSGAYLDSNSDSDLTVSGKVKDEEGEFYTYSSSASQTTTVGAYRIGTYVYSACTFTISSDDGYNRVYANYSAE